MSRTLKILKQQQIFRITVTLGRSKYTSTFNVRIEEQMPGVLRPTAVLKWRCCGISALPLDVTRARIQLSSRDSFVQTCGKIRRGVTQSPIGRALTSQPTGPAIYSQPLIRRKINPAKNSSGGNSGHQVQPRHSQPRRN